MIPGSLVTSSKKKQGQSLPAGRMIFTSANGSFVWSDDGVTWAQITPFGSGALVNTCRALCSNGSVVVAGVGNGTNAGSKIYYSLDGVNWSVAIDLPSATYGSPSSICYGNGFFYAIMSVEGYLYKSADGINWELSGNAGFSWPSASEVRAGVSINYGNGVFIATGHQLNLTTSADGVTWTQRRGNLGGFTQYENRISNTIYSAVSNRWVYVADDCYVSTSTDNGASWAARTRLVANTTDLNYLQMANNLLFTVRGTSNLFYSADGGLSWARLDKTGTRGVVFKDGYYYVQSGLTIQRTTDLVNYVTVGSTITAAATAALAIIL